MTYLALKPIKLPGGETRMPGELVPEAAKWPNLDNWAAAGHVVFLPDGTEDEFVGLLKTGGSVMHLAPHAKHHHLAAARMQFRHGGGVDLPTSKTDATPSPTGEPDAADLTTTTPDTKQKLASRLRGASRRKS